MESNGKAILEVEEAGNAIPRPEIVQVLEAHRGERHIVVLQDFPDPDAISSAFAHQIVSAEFDIEADIVYGGRISHQQNIALVKLLGIELIRYNESLNLEQYAGAVFVDNQGTTAKAIVEATTHFRDPKIIAEVSRNLGEPMVGRQGNDIPSTELLAQRGW